MPWIQGWALPRNEAILRRFHGTETIIRRRETPILQVAVEERWWVSEPQSSFGARSVAALERKTESDGHGR